MDRKLPVGLVWIYFLDPCMIGQQETFAEGKNEMDYDAADIAARAGHMTLCQILNLENSKVAIPGQGVHCSEL